MKNIKESFYPAVGLKNRHLQTLTPVILGKYYQVPYVREELILPDGDFVDLDWVNVPDPDCKKPILIIFHGLEGSSQSHYAKSLLHKVRQNNGHAVVMNFRSCSGRENKMPRLYHSGETGDASFFIEWLRQRFPFAPLNAVGFSLGGNMLLKLAGEKGNNLELNAIISVSAPIKLNESTRYMVKGVSSFYQSFLLKQLKQKLLKKYLQYDYQSLIGMGKDDLLGCRNIREFDNLFTARLHGFENAEDYYQRSSAYPYIKKITRPCLIIHAKDDPIAPSYILPSASDIPNNIQLDLTAYGGHVGFFSGSIFKPGYWLADRILTYFSYNEKTLNG
ncbi:MAG: hydrolase [Gammaproteobacteria bacterium]|nr:hydrolase [Gammaproteobacteria bacterium]